MSRSHILAVVAALALTGCGGGTSEPAGSEPEPTRTPYVFATPPPISSPALSADGLGEIRLGTPATDAQTRGWAIRDERCGWRTGPHLKATGVELFFADDAISEVWLGNSSHSTTTGARVGMAVEQIETLHPDLEFERRDTVGGSAYLSIVRSGDRELLFYGLGDEDATPDPRSPLTGIAARAYGTPLTRPACPS